MKEVTEAQKLATAKVHQLRRLAQNDFELAELIGMSKVTMYTRLKIENWKITEMALINQL